MTPNKKVKLSRKQVEVIQTIQKEGIYRTQNSKNPTVQKLISMKLCEFNSNYDGLVLTAAFKDAPHI